MATKSSIYLSLLTTNTSRFIILCTLLPLKFCHLSVKGVLESISSVKWIPLYKMCICVTLVHKSDIQQPQRGERCNQNLAQSTPYSLRKQQDLMALCIAYHSEQPGGYHNQLKESREYQGFMAKYGKQWRFRRYD